MAYILLFIAGQIIYSLIEEIVKSLKKKKAKQPYIRIKIFKGEIKEFPVITKIIVKTSKQKNEHPELN